MSTRKKVATKPLKASPKAIRTAQLLAENHGMAIGTAMRAAGYSDVTSLKPQNLTTSKQWPELLDRFLPQDALLAAHENLLKASRIDHETFNAAKELTDEHIHEMFNELGCSVRRIVHRENGVRDVYFWSPDNRARKDALDMGYKLRGTYAAEKHLHVGFSLVGLNADRATQTEVLPPAPSVIEIEP